MGFGLFGCGRWLDGCGCCDFGGWCGFGGFGFCALDDILDDIIIDCNGWCGFGGWC